jgi:MFS transporter, Spinster family, sphingosine-1-phosphate transporter
MANEAVTGKSGLTRRSAAYGLGLMTLLNFVNYIDRYVFPAVAPRIKEALSITDTELGLLGSAFLVSYFVVSPLFGWLGDRFSRTRLMSVGVAVWSLATAGGGLARGFGQMLFARGSVGVGEASYAAISPALISDYYPPARRGRVFAIFYLAIPVGSAVGYLLGGAIESHFGWRAAFFAVGLPGLLLALLALTAPDPPRGINDEPPAVTHQDSAGTYLHTLGLLVRNRGYVLAVLGYAAYTFAVGGMSFWVPTYLYRELRMPLDRANYVLGVVTVIAGIGGTFLGGYIADALAPRIRQAHLWLSGVSMVLAIPFTCVAFTTHSSGVFAASLLAAEFMVFLSTGPINVVIVSVVPVAIRATAMAVSIFVIHLLGDAAAPVVLGAVSQSIGLSKAVLIMPGVVALSAAIWIFAAWKPGLTGSRQ